MVLNCVTNAGCESFVLCCAVMSSIWETFVLGFQSLYLLPIYKASLHSDILPTLVFVFTIVSCLY